MQEIFIHYKEVVTLVQQEFDRNIGLYGNQIQCGRGCASCCSQMFRITIMDAVMISRHMKSLPKEERVELQIRARAYLKDRDHLMHASVKEAEISSEDDISTTGLRLPCAALQGDICQIHEARPLVCRKWGMLLYDPRHSERLQACELNFPPGTAIEDDELEELVDRQTEIAERWQSVKAAVNDHLHPEHTATTIAHAMLLDYDTMMNKKASKPVSYEKD